jgi:multiple sugar transport system permease protein
MTAAGEGISPTVGTVDAATARSGEAGTRARRAGSRLLFLALLVVATVIFVYPFVWLVSASLKPGSEVFNNALLPTRLVPENYTELFRVAPVLNWVWNSVMVSFLAAGFVTITSAMVAWGFSYFRFRFRNVLFGVLLATMMLPGAVTLIPTFLIWDAAGFNGTLVPLWAQNLFASAFYVFLLRQFFLGLPREVFEAARVDGASHPRMFLSIAVPLTLPALIVVFIFELKAAWTDLQRGLIFLHDQLSYTLPVGLKALIDSPSIGGEKQWELLAAAGVVVTIPMAIIFFLGQRYFVEGIATTGSKG